MKITQIIKEEIVEFSALTSFLVFIISYIVAPVWGL